MSDCDSDSASADENKQLEVVDDEEDGAAIEDGAHDYAKQASAALTQHELQMICMVCAAYMLLQPSSVFLGTIRQLEESTAHMYIGECLMVYFIGYMVGCIVHARFIDSVDNVFIYFLIFALLSLFSAGMFILFADAFVFIPILITTVNAISSSALFPCLMHFISIYFSDEKLYSVMCVFALFKIVTDILFNVGISLTTDWVTSIYIALIAGAIGVFLFVFTSRLLNPDQISKETEVLPVLSLEVTWYLFSKTPYCTIIASASFLVVLYTLNAFTTMMLTDIHASDASTLVFSDLMLPVGMWIAIAMALWWNQSAGYRATLCGGKWKLTMNELGLSLSIVILIGITLVTWLAEMNVIVSRQSMACLVVYDALFLLYGCAIAYPLFVTNFVALIRITKYRISVAIAASFLNGFMTFTSATYSILASAFAQDDATPLHGWKWVTLILIPFAVIAVYLYRKLTTHEDIWRGGKRHEYEIAMQHQHSSA